MPTITHATSTTTVVPSARHVALAGRARGPREGAGVEAGQARAQALPQARDEALAKGVTINGLVILSDSPLPWNPEHTNPPGGLDEYYRRNVTGGPGSFVMVAENHNSFGQAIVKKMIAEIAFNPPPRPVVMR